MMLSSPRLLNLSACIVLIGVLRFVMDFLLLTHLCMADLQHAFHSFVAQEVPSSIRCLTLPLTVLLSLQPTFCL
jgi:hypothetical protein